MTATCWPRQLPASVRNNSLRRAEVHVYDRLKSALDPEFHVFYSSPWIGTDRLGRERDGECDFLVAHPRLGILAIEVKGGSISYSPEDKGWRSRDRQGFTHCIKDPIAQARSAKYNVIASLNDNKKWRSREVYKCHGVILPDVERLPEQLGADRPQRLFCCGKELRYGLRAWIGSRLREGNQPRVCEPLGRDGIGALEDKFAKPFTLNFRIGAQLAEAENEFSILEPRQYDLLENIKELPRVAVKGGAGTGKTILAMEEAVRCAEEGLKTAFLCFNRPLAENVRRSIGDVTNLTVDTFHAFCRRSAKEVGITVDETGVEDKSYVYRNLLPNALVEATTNPRYSLLQALIIDEAQDFADEWWVSLEYVLAAEARLRTFFDCNQAIYQNGSLAILGMEMAPVRLKNNLRNTQNIHHAAAVHYQGPPMISEGPEGPNVEWFTVQDESRKIRYAYNELKRLINHEEVDPGEVAVLLNSKVDIQRFIEAAARSRLEFCSADERGEGQVVVDTVRRFKGLERLVIILVISSDDMVGTELAYVGFTRARYLLMVVATERELESLSGS